MAGNVLLETADSETAALLRPHLKTVELKSHTVLHHAGHRPSLIYFPEHGRIALLSMTGDGSSVQVAGIGREGAVGLSLDGERFGAEQTVVQVPGTALTIGQSEFWALARGNPALLTLALRAQSVITASIRQNAACNALHPVDRRMCRFLLELFDHGGAGHLSLTQEFVAEMMGVQRATVSLTAHHLKVSGLINYSRGAITLLDRTGLEKRACECYGTHKEQFPAPN